MRLNDAEQSIWELIEQDLIPSAREGAYLDYRDVLANAWAAGARAMIDGENLDWINNQNPYADPNRHTEAK